MEYTKEIKKSLFLKGIVLYISLILLQNLLCYIGKIENDASILNMLMPIFINNNSKKFAILNIAFIISFFALLVFWGLNNKKVKFEYKRKIIKDVFIVGFIFVLFSLMLSFQWSKTNTFAVDGFRGSVKIGGLIGNMNWDGIGFEINESYYNKNGDLLFTLYRSPYAGIESGVKEETEITIVNSNLFKQANIKFTILCILFFAMLLFIQVGIISICLDVVLVKETRNLEINKED